MDADVGAAFIVDAKAFVGYPPNGGYTLTIVAGTVDGQFAKAKRE